MWKKIAIAGAIGAAVLGSGAAALAVSGSSTPTPSSTGSSSSGTSTGGTAGSTGKHAGGKGERLRLALKNFEHGEWVTQGKSGAVTHDAIKGTVTSVSSTSITVTAGDKTSETYVVDSSTKVRDGKIASAIGSIKTNDTVVVTGTKTGSTPTALHILDGGTK